MALKPMKPCNAPGCGALVRGVRYCPKHEHLSAAWASSNRAKRAAITGRPWRRLRGKILQRDSYLCRCDECIADGTLREAHEVDHRIPLAQGGTDDPSNLCAINRDCHAKKTQRESLYGRGLGAD